MHQTRFKTAPRYICPQTRSDLHEDGQALRTLSGEFEYPLHRGVPQFLRFSPVEDEATRIELEHLNRLASESDWGTALRAVYGDKANEIRYVTDIARGSFISLLPVGPETDILEIGPGLGQFTAQLARQARSVWAIEVVAGQAEFAAARCRQQGLTNVEMAVGGDDCRLPYGDGAFDLVVLNLVFEWCASRCVDETQIDVQRRLLSEIYRVLRPGGSLYLTTKNRFALRYLIGKPDEHFYDLRFGSALPRWLGRVLLRLTGHARPMGLLHSHNALKLMLLDAGFHSATSFWATPEMRYPAHYVCTDAACVREARRKPGFIQGEGRSTRTLMRLIPASLVKQFTPGLAFLAMKGQPSHPR